MDSDLTVTTILDALGINETILYFAYGQVFFTLGLIIAFQSRKHSRLALANHLRWLAAFGIVHGVYEWGHAFIPVKAAYLTPQVHVKVALVGHDMRW
jgi:hypothetical protein